MNVDEQRRLGVRLEKEGDGPKTLAAVKTLNSTFEDILKVAVNEIGVDKLMSYLEEVPV